MKKPNLQIEWRYTANVLPDEETTVLVAHGEREVSEGYLLAGRWLYQHHPDVIAVEIAEVYAWADMPEGPGIYR